MRLVNEMTRVHMKHLKAYAPLELRPFVLHTAGFLHSNTVPVTPERHSRPRVGAGGPRLESASACCPCITMCCVTHEATGDISQKKGTGREGEGREMEGTEGKGKEGKRRGEEGRRKEGRKQASKTKYVSFTQQPIHPFILREHTASSVVLFHVFIFHKIS